MDTSAADFFKENPDVLLAGESFDTDASIATDGMDPEAMVGQTDAQLDLSDDAIAEDELTD